MQITLGFLTRINIFIHSLICLFICKSKHFWSRNKKNHGWEQGIHREHSQKIREQSLFSIEYSGLMQTYKEILWINIFVLTSSSQKLTINRSSRLYINVYFGKFLLRTNNTETNRDKGSK